MNSFKIITFIFTFQLLFGCAKSFKKRDMPKMKKVFNVELSPIDRWDVNKPKEKFFYLTKHLKEINDPVLAFLADDSMTAELYFGQHALFYNLEDQNENFDISTFDRDILEPLKKEVNANLLSEKQTWLLTKKTKDAEYDLMIKVIEFRPGESLKLSISIESFKYRR
ncbi:hypothetical protein N9N67_03060 [Bacteriovoracaceae bacterium]|nr:hypothetical protein [Bacteriovoracaceae bacterium]